MSKDKEKVEETTDEEVTLEGDGLVTEEAEDASSESEGDVEEEEVDERGVPLKNVVAELTRKLEASTTRESSYKDLLQELKTNKQEPTPEQIKELIESVSDGEFEKENISSSTAALIRKAAKIEAKKILAERESQINDEAKGLQAKNAEFIADRQESLKEVKDALSGDFGNLFLENGNWDTSSEIYKRTCEIFNNSPRLRNRATGQAEAAMKAEMELTKAKYGKEKPPKKQNTSERLKGTGSGSGGKTGKFKDSSGNFTRELSDPEFDALKREDQAKYLEVEGTLVKR